MAGVVGAELLFKGHLTIQVGLVVAVQTDE
jgi:hypothetical protein